MATIIIHGTMTFLKAHHYTWWWNSFSAGGFCHAIAEGMRAAGRQPDVWRVGGVHVNQIPELARNPRNGNMITPEGHYEWSGGDSDAAREAGGKFMAYYVNAISRIAPDESIDVVAHSHGGNVVKIATIAPHLDPGVRSETWCSSPVHTGQARSLMVSLTHTASTPLGSYERLICTLKKCRAAQVGYRPSRAMGRASGGQRSDWGPD